MKNNEKYVT